MIKIKDSLGRAGIPLILIALTVLAYSNSFSGTWHLDDFRTIVEYDYATATWRSLFAFSPQRALGMWSFWLNYLLHGYDVWGWHFVNLVIHAVNVLLVYYFFLLLLRCSCVYASEVSAKYRRVTAGICAALFAVHPAQVQAVTYIVQRMEILGVTWVLLMTLGAIHVMIDTRWRARVLWGIVAFVAAVCGGLTKEIIAAAPVLAGAYLVVLHVRTWKARVTISAVCGAVALVIMLSALMFFGALTWTPWPRISGAPFDILWAYAPEPAVYYPTQVRVLLLFLRWCVWPSGLCIEMEIPHSLTWLDPRVLFAGFFQIALLAYAGLLWRRGRPMALFGLIWFYVMMAPSSVLPNGIFVHRVYGALVGVIIAVCLPLARWVSERPTRTRAFYTQLVLGAAGIIIVIFSVMTYQRNRLFHSGIALWGECVERAPLNWRAHANYGFELLSEGDIASAGPYLKRSYDMRPDVWLVANNLGLYYYHAGRPRDSLVYMEKALKMRPDNEMLQENVGTLYLYLGRVVEGTNMLNRVRNVTANNTMAEYFMEQKAYDEAIRYYRRAHEHARSAEERAVLRAAMTKAEELSHRTRQDNE